MEEKYGKDELSASDSDSESESEDDEAVLATEELDAEIFDVLNAIKSKDPRAYDKNATFYKTPIDAPNGSTPPKKEKPVRLQDYHRQNLLNSNAVDEEEGEDAPMTYNQEQAALKRNVVKSMHDAAGNGEEGTDSDGEELFTRKPGQDKAKPKVSAVELDIASADRDPETYLSNFMAARAWVPGKSSKFQPFESDDESDDERAEAFEAAYNMRFEDPARANEKLLTHSRQAAEKYSVRREDAKGRKKAREREKEAKEAAKRERDEEKARLRKLKIDEAQEKLERFKAVAGLHGKGITDEEWAKFVNADWDDAQWSEEMAKRFGDDYYDDAEEQESDVDDDNAVTKARKRAKKPKFDDDIDIADLVPDFDEDAEREALQKYKLTDDEAAEGDDSDGGIKLDDADSEDRNTEDIAAAKHKRKKQVVEQMRREQRKQARKEKMKIEEMVDEDLVTDETMVRKSTGGGMFRYRETSPGAFGLSARDILMADDSQLNQFVGLKKMAAFRDAEKKRKDKKKLGKKARLRQWRRDTFGDDSGPQMSFQEFLASRMPDDEQAERMARKHARAEAGNGDTEELPVKQKKKRSRKRKAEA